MFNLSVFSIVFVLTGLTMLAGFGEAAFGQGACSAVVIKEAPGGSGVLFPFEVTSDGKEPFLVGIEGGGSEGGTFNSGVTVTELPLAGWRLSGVECESTGATGFEITENGFTATCDGGGDVTCMFTNVSAVSNIPTLSEWGMIAAAAGLGLVGVFFAVRRRKAVAN